MKSNQTARKTNHEDQAVDKAARLNVVISKELHRRVKVGCAVEGVSMTDLVVEFLEKRFSAGKY